MRYRIRLDPDADFNRACDIVDQIGFKLVKLTPAYQRFEIEGGRHLAEQLVQVPGIKEIAIVTEIPLPSA